MKKRLLAASVILALLCTMLISVTSCSPFGSLFGNDGTRGLSFKLNDDKKSYSVSCYLSNVKNIVIPETHRGKPVTKIAEHAFGGCIELESVSIPYGVEKIEDFAFSNCAKLMSVIIPNSVRTIGDDAFYGCHALSSIVISDSVVSVGEDAFACCGALRSATIPYGMVSISEGMFMACIGLTSITIPETVSSIEDAAFYSCRALTRINFEGTMQMWNSIKKVEDWNYNVGINAGTCTIYCKDGSIEMKAQ